MLIQKKGKLYNIQPSLYLTSSMRLLTIKKILDIAIRKKAPLHIWFHPWNFGTTPNQIEKYNQKVFSPFLKYAKTKEKDGLLKIENMVSAAKIADEKSSNQYEK